MLLSFEVDPAIEDSGKPPSFGEAINFLHYFHPVQYRPARAAFAKAIAEAATAALNEAWSQRNAA